MRINEYFLLSDISNLSSEEFQCLVSYLRFIGIGSYHTQSGLLRNRTEDSVWAVFSGYQTVTLVMARTGLYNEELTVCQNANEIQRMVELGRCM